MPLLRGSASITRFRVVNGPETPDFERRRFEEIPPQSEIRERIGFLPLDPEAPYEVGTRRFFFRARIDRRRPDATAVRERVQEMVRAELAATGREFVGSKRRREMRMEAEQELLSRTMPRTKIIECCLDNGLLLVGTCAKADLGLVVQALREIGVQADLLTPWLEDGEDPQGEMGLDLGIGKEPGHSILGCRFVRDLLEDPEVLVEPVQGSVRLVTKEAKVALSGGVLPELLRYVEQGAEILSAKLVVGDLRFRFEAPAFRIHSLRVETERHEHWTQLLDERLEKIAALWELLDGKYRSVRSRPAAPVEDAAVPA